MTEPIIVPLGKHHITGQIPSVKHIKAFGTPVIARKTGTRATKIDPHAFNRIFLRFTGTTRNAAYYDIHSGQVKTATQQEREQEQLNWAKEALISLKKTIIVPPSAVANTL